jgi:hypothetical protein
VSFAASARLASAAAESIWRRLVSACSFTCLAAAFCASFCSASSARATAALKSRAASAFCAASTWPATAGSTVTASVVDGGGGVGFTVFGSGRVAK